MRDNHSLDAVLGTLSATGTSEVPADFMDGVWQRAGQLGEIADRRRRTERAGATTDANKKSGNGE